MRDIGDNFRAICDGCVIMTISSRTSTPTTFKGINDSKAGCFRSERERYCRITLLDAIKMKIKKWPLHIALFRMEWLLGWIRNGVWDWVRVDIFRPESESLEIHRLHSPGSNPVILSPWSSTCSQVIVWCILTWTICLVYIIIRSLWWDLCCIVWFTVHIQ